jgi:DNA-binding SARP family transcriptional activator
LNSDVLELAFLGGLSVQRSDRSQVEISSQKALALLCYLAMTRRPQSRLALAGLLWGGMPESQALMNLRKAINKLRKPVGDYLLINRQQLAFNHDKPHRIDAASLDQAPLPANPALGDNHITAYSNGTGCCSL